jgi:N-acetylmuramoyl-L-alanine amidase
LVNLFYGAAAEADPALTGVRMGLDSDRTRLVIDLSDPVAADTTLLTGPDRLAIDLPTIDWKLPATAATGGVGLIKGYRFTKFDAKTSRIVFDLSGPARIVRSFSLPPNSGYQDRFVVDLAPGAVPGAKPVAQRGGAPPPTPSATADATARVPAPQHKPRQLSLTVMVDPGHGGADPGTIGLGGSTEKTIVLSVGQKLKETLKAKGYRVLMTRDSDIYPSLKDRVAMARDAKADLFISLHADSNSNGHLRGASVYTLSDTASDDETAELARKENRSDSIAGVDISAESDDVSWIIIELTMRETMNQSAKFARTLKSELADATPMLKNPHRFAGFRVLKAPDLPSVLIELGQLSNANDEKRLNDPSAEGRLADAITRAVDRYFDVDRRAALN